MSSSSRFFRASHKTNNKLINGANLGHGVYENLKFNGEVRTGTHRVKRSLIKDTWTFPRSKVYVKRGINIRSQSRSIGIKFARESKTEDVTRTPGIEIESLSTFINDALTKGWSEVEIVMEARDKFKGTEQIYILKVINQVKEKRFEPSAITKELSDEIDQWENID